MGKTAFSLNIAQHAAIGSNIPVVIFSLEMSASKSVPPGNGSDNDAVYGVVIKPGHHEGLYYTQDRQFLMCHWVMEGGQPAASGGRSGPMDPGPWYQLVGVVHREAGTTRLYVNGELQPAQGSWTPGGETLDYSTNRWRIGIARPNVQGWGWAADGDIDEVRLYDWALAPDKIEEIYQAERSSLSNWGFEIPVAGPPDYHVYYPENAGWYFAGGVAANDSFFTRDTPDAPEGVQVGFVQSTGEFWQWVYLAAGTYRISFQSCQRVGWNSAEQDFELRVDSRAVGTFIPGDTYQQYSTDGFTVADGQHIIRFRGLNSAGGDNTAFVDVVELLRVL